MHLLQRLDENRQGEDRALVPFETNRRSLALREVGALGLDPLDSGWWALLSSQELIEGSLNYLAMNNASMDHALSGDVREDYSYTTTLIGRPPTVEYLINKQSF